MPQTGVDVIVIRLLAVHRLGGAVLGLADVDSTSSISTAVSVAAVVTAVAQAVAAVVAARLPPLAIGE